MSTASPSLGRRPAAAVADPPSRLCIKPRLSIGVAIPAGLGLVYVAVGLWIALGQGAFWNDELARTGNALNVVHGRDPHLGAIGFVWNPLPTVVQVPLVAALDPLGLAFLAGPLMSAAFSLASLAALERTLRLFGLGTRLRASLLLLYGLNPIVVLYAANGMSEAAFVCCLLGATYQYLRWTRGGGFPALIAFALLSAAAFLARYEAVVFAGAAVLALILAWSSEERLEPDRLEAILLAYIVPVAYAGTVWMLFNWMLMGDPLYFQRSAYGNLVQTQTFFRTGQSYLTGVIQSVPGTLAYGLTRWTALFPAMPLLSLIALAKAARARDRVLLGLLGLAVCVPAFGLYLLYTGTSYGWLRFFIYSVPFGFVLLGYLLRTGRSQAAVWVALLGACVALPTSGWALAEPSLGREESGLVRHVLDPATPLPTINVFPAERHIAAYVDAAPPDSVVLMDAFLGFAADVFARHHERFAVTSDRDFQALVGSPSHGVTDVLVPSSSCPAEASCLAQSDQVAAAYPELWASGATWARLEQDFGGQNGWRLYRVVSPSAP